MAYLLPYQVAERWNLNTRTLANWRTNGCGPRYRKIGGRISYAIADIEKFEQDRIASSTSEYDSNARSRNA